jgi:hypothetical protein
MRRAQLPPRVGTAGNRHSVSSLRRLSIAGFAFLLVGCYTLQPTGGPVPQLGTIIGLDLNDAGRAALGGSMGPEIGQVEGRLIQKDSGEFVVAVTDVHLLRGGDQVWRGEAVHIKSGYVSSVYARRFSAARSAALAAAGVGAVALIATRGLIGLGSTDQGGMTPGDTAHTQRRPRP